MSLELLNDFAEDLGKKLLRHAADVANELRQGVVDASLASTDGPSEVVTASVQPESTAQVIDASYDASSPEGSAYTPEDVRVQEIRAAVAEDLGISNTDAIQVTFDAYGNPEISVVNAKGTVIARIVPIDSLDSGTAAWFTKNVDADQTYIISTLEGDAKPFTTARELMRLGVINKDDIIYFNDHLSDDSKGFCYKNNQLLVINYDGTWTCQGDDCPPVAPVAEPKAAEPEIIPAPVVEPEIIAESPAPEVVATPEPEVVPVTDTTVWYQDRIFVWCPEPVVAEVFMVDTTGLSVEESAERAREVARTLPSDYQSNVPADKRFVLIRVLDENGEETEKLKCLTLKTGEVSDYNPNVSGYGPQSVRPGDVWGYVTGRDGINDGSPYGNGPDVVHPHPLARYDVVDANADGTIDGLKEVVRPLENAVWVQVQFIGESIFGPEWMLKDENQALWDKLLALEIPDRVFEEGISAQEQVSRLKSFVRSELGYRMSTDEAERMIIWMNEYASEADTSFLKFDYTDRGYASARTSGTFGEFFRASAEEAARRGELGPVAIKK